jgi:hypothetical protein
MRRQVGARSNCDGRTAQHRIVVVLCLCLRYVRWELDCVDLITGTVGEISTDS